MSSPNYGEDYSYASTRLRDTVVLDLDGAPLYISDITQEGGIVGGYLGDLSYCIPPIDHLNLHLDDVDTSPFKLGYINQGGRAQFAERTPTRYYKQGMNRNNVHSDANIYGAGVRKTIVGEYPSLSECMELVSCGEKLSWAFSRNFCVSGGEELNLLFRDEVVGKCLVLGERDVIPQLSEEFNFLSEMLQEEYNV